MEVLTRYIHTALIILMLNFFPCLVQAADLQVQQAEFKHNNFQVLCYHAVLVRGKKNDPYTMSQKVFSGQIEYLRSHKFHFISLQQIFDARDGKADLPDKAILLTFDDGYVSYIDFVAPFLSRQHIPSIVAVVGGFIGAHPSEMPKLPDSIMSWKQIKKISANPYVEVVSHSYDLHHAIQYNAIGNVAAVASVLGYNASEKKYETETEYRNRLNHDFLQQESLFVKNLGFKPRALVWPYGRYNAVSNEVAQEHGMQAMFTLEWGFNNAKDLHAVHRTLLKAFPLGSTENPMDDFIVNIKQPEWSSKIIRAAQLDLDVIYDPESFKQTDKNLGMLIDRLVKIGVNRVYLQAFADPDGDGNVEGVYFPNRQLPVVSDLFSHAAHQIFIRGIEVFAWMPTLAVTFPDAAFNKTNRVMEKKNGVIKESTSWYHRLSPFSHAARTRMQQLYEDLASHAQIDGVLFQDDAYLNDYEDFNPMAMRAYKQHFGADFEPKNDTENHESALKLAQFKGHMLNEFIESLKQSILKYRPEAKFSRNIYASVVSNPDSEAWFSENFADYLNRYDEVVVMAYPEMEKQAYADQWLKQLVAAVNSYPDAANKVVYKLQTFNWFTGKWIASSNTLERMRSILSSGGVHLAYYPDNVFKNMPNAQSIRLEMSQRNIP